MKKLIVAMLACVFFCQVFCVGLSMTASAESLYIRKVVSVVYDDSGSMGDNGSVNWAYANYAMQAFCGLLNADDQLYITYMSDAEKNSALDPSEIDLSATEIQASLDSIRQHSAVGNTPYASIDIAFNKLKSIEDSNVNTQYWLVVITDGDFQDASGDAVPTEELNEKLNAYAAAEMPNHSTPQVIYLAIGDSASKPDDSLNNSLYTMYSSTGAGDIVGVMSNIADKISCRSKLSVDDIVKKGTNAIEVKSSVSLMNIAVLSQKNSAKILGASCDNGTKLNISRAVSISYPEHLNWVTDKTLNGTAFLINSPSANIAAGTYTIQFSEDVDLNDIVVMFEPALEIRMRISVNGEEIADHQELRSVSEGDKVSISCEVYEMGTNKEIDPDLLPSGTKFDIYISEAGKVVEQRSGKGMSLPEYILNNIETEIKSSLAIPEFNSIDYSVQFTPAKAVPKTVYSITSEYGSNDKSVKFDDIASNKDLSIVYTIYADGVALTDPEAVKALNPIVSVQPEGNDGDVSYSADGKIIFKPNSASGSSSDQEDLDVEVTCTLGDGTKNTATYTVLYPKYQVVPIDTDANIKKTNFCGNKVGVSFYITKDGVRLKKEAVESNIDVVYNDSHRELSSNIDISTDGVITVIPYSNDEYHLTFWNWWINWAHYFGLCGDDLIVTLNHMYGSASSTIDVVGEDISYQILNVYLPLALELISLILLCTWIVLIIIKPRYMKGAILYVGEIKYNKERGTHTLRNFSAVRLEKFNKIKRGNGRLKFKRDADVVTANGIKIRADNGGRIICEMLFPWYKGKVEAGNSDFTDLRTPADISNYIITYKKLEINEFATTETIEGEHARSLTPANSKIAKYIVVPDSGDGVTEIAGRKVIRSGKIFIYIKE